jgi:hypothetical protein
MLDKYPYISKKEFPALDDQYIFFQSESLKETLTRKYLPSPIHQAGDEYHRALGGLLQYPQCCIDYFLSEERQQQSKRAFLLYYGMTCAVSMRDLEEAASHLWDLIPNPADDTLVLKEDEFYTEIPFRDIKFIQHLQSLSNVLK